MKNLLIRGGTVVNHDHMQKSDVYIEDGIIKFVKRKVDTSIDIPTQLLSNTKVIDAEGMLVMPGGIDAHTHLETYFVTDYGTVNSLDDYFHGSKAAVAGGTTMFIDFAIAGRGHSLIEEVNSCREKARNKACCDYAQHVAITWWSEKVEKEMEILCEKMGINSFKIFMAYSGRLDLDSDDKLYDVFRKCRQLGAIAQVHAENGKIILKKENELIKRGITGPEGHLQSRPEELEAEATQRAIIIADQASCPLYVVHVNSKSPADIIAKERKAGKVVFGEPIAAGLGLDGSHCLHSSYRHAAVYVMSPPLRLDPTTPGHLMDLLANGDLECTGSDNASPSLADKAKFSKTDFRLIPNGINGIEDRMSVIWEKGVHNGKMDPCRFVAVTSTNAAKIFNLFPKKGEIGVGSDADIVVWDPEKTRTISVKTHHHACDYNIFEGMQCHGCAVYTISNGVVVWERGKLNVTPGSGRFIETPCFAPYVYSRILQREKVRKPIKIERNENE